jgi:MFS family permease
MINVLILATAGYIAFVIGALVIWTMSKLSNDDQVIYWNAGLFVAFAFALSEIFNTGRGKVAGIVRRIGVSAGTVIAMIITTIFVSESLGWRATYELQDQTAARQDLMAIALSIIGVVIVWIAWIRKWKSG